MGLEEVHQHGDSPVLSDSILCHLCSGMAAGNVSQGTHTALYNFVSASGTVDSPEQSLHAMQLTQNGLEGGRGRGGEEGGEGRKEGKEGRREGKRGKGRKGRRIEESGKKGATSHTQ